MAPSRFEGPRPPYSPDPYGHQTRTGNPRVGKLRFDHVVLVLLVCALFLTVAGAVVVGLGGSPAVMYAGIPMMVIVVVPYGFAALIGRLAAIWLMRPGRLCPESVRHSAIPSRFGLGRDCPQASACRSYPPGTLHCVSLALICSRPVVARLRCIAAAYQKPPSSYDGCVVLTGRVDYSIIRESASDSARNRSADVFSQQPQFGSARRRSVRHRRAFSCVRDLRRAR